MALPGIALKSGNINNVSINKSPQNTAVRPVLPPSSTPLALSTNDVVVLTPTSEPAAVATASASRVFSSFTTPSFLFSSNIPALVPTPASVPIESKRSVTKNVIITGSKARLKAPFMSSSKNIGEIEAGVEKISVG